MFAVSLALRLPYIPLLESFQTHELLVYQCAATESPIVCIGSLLQCDLNLQTQIRLSCRQGVKTLDQLSVNCCRVPTMTRYMVASHRPGETRVQARG